MLPESDLAEYLTEIRRRVCTLCPERPLDGPPCGPLGKPCGIEMHLPKLIESVHRVHSGLIEPYLACDRERICATCPLLHGSDCPCPMDYLAVLLVQAVEAVDARRERRRHPARVPILMTVG